MKIRKVNEQKALVTIDGAARLIDIAGLDLNDEATVTAKFHQKPEPAQSVARVARLSVTARRNKMIAIGQESVRSRDRVFPSMPHVPASRKNQAYDGLLAMLYRGRITTEQKIIVRNLKTGEYDEMTVGQLLDEVADMFAFQLKLRARDREYRKQVNDIYDDTRLSEDEKAKRIEAIELPEFLDVDELSEPGFLRSIGRRREDGGV